jgi:hypothetical protein
MVNPTIGTLRPGRYLPIVLWLAGLGGLNLADAADALPAKVEFNREIRPILSDKCFQCHGPDKARRKADLRLDTEAGAFADLGGYRAIVPHKLADSELYRRITAADADKRMPPARAGRTLTKRQIDLIKRWIEQGAKWQKHWAFIPPARPALPHSKNASWARNPIDIFILDRLEREGLRPALEADKATLLRRVTLDLTGLPPTAAEVDAFLADRSPSAYEKVVDRLLASPRYGERMAVRWLDAARYADTNGYQTDGPRTMWRWRDWVIAAYNRNMPFDQFTIEQLAGDMLPRPTLDQRIATGFNRNHRGNAEGGIIPEEYAVEYVVDRVDTTATVWLGLTMGCARCHDHKYDPILQKEFYQVYAYFNNVSERGKAIKFGNSPPFIKAPTPEQQEQRGQLERQLAAAEADFARRGPELAAAQAQWEKSLALAREEGDARKARATDWVPSRRLVAHYPLDGDTADRTGHQRTSAKFEEGAAAYAAGPRGKAADFDGKRFLDAGNVGNFGFQDKFSLAAWVYPRSVQAGVVLSRMAETDRAEGYHVRFQGGKLQVNLVKRWLDDALRVETERSLSSGCWYHLMVTYDGSRTAQGIRVYIDGRPHKIKVLLDDLNQSFKTSQPLRIGSGGGPQGRLRGLVADVRIYDDRLSAEEVELVAARETIRAIVAIPAEQRTAGQARKLRAYFLEQHAPRTIREAHRPVLALRDRKAKLLASFPTTMVMEEMPKPRDTFVLIRGQYDKPGEKVTPGVPKTLSSLPRGVKNDRLGFARWLMDPANPLTARVAVNRYWQMYFGTGLVKTAEDFGSQGEWPSHPELVDWLATEFMRTGWDVKRMQRLIVTSATYRQSSRVTRDLLQRDPDNRFLARGPRLRLSAEMIRDQVLAVSGLLVERIGGPSVKPYQPPGLWRELADAVYHQDHGPALYRRSLYTFWKRTVAPPAMVAFDAAGREACTVRKARTNTPLQALTLMNDVTFIEAARVLAQRIMNEGDLTPEERLALAFRLATGRAPQPAELKILRAGFHKHLAHYRRDKAAARKLVSAGEAPRDERLDVSELAAYTTVATLILNLDEVITKG